MNKALLVIPASVLMVNAASAATFFTDVASWTNAANGTVLTETFDGDTLDNTVDNSTAVGSFVDGSYNAINGTDSFGFDLTATTANSATFDARSPFRHGNTGNGVFFDTAPLKTLTFDFDGSASAFSFYGHDLFDTALGEYSLEIELSYDGGATFVTEFLTDNTIGLGPNQSGEVDFTLSDSSRGSINFGQDTIGGVGDGVFFGFVSSSGITNARITHITLDEQGENIGFDQVSVVAAPIPEPSSALLLALGALGLITRRKRS